MTGRKVAAPVSACHKMIEKTGLDSSMAVNAPLFKSLLRWCHEGARTGVFKAPRWTGLNTNAGVMAAIVVADLLLAAILQRFYIVGQATFYWQAVTGGWISTALCAWCCYLLSAQDPAQRRPGAAPGAAHLLTMALAQGTSMTLGAGVFFVALVRAGIFTEKVLGAWGLFALWLAPVIWMVLAQLVLLWRGGDRRHGPMAIAMLAVVASWVLFYAARPAEFWYPVEPQQAKDARPYLRLTQQLMEAQPQLLARGLARIKPQRAGSTDLYAITFAPYEADVFRNESGVVAQVMASRFHADGRVLELVNHAGAVATLPWATTLNLRRAIQRFAQVMDREEDILFIHLTSHGARDGELAANFWPLEVEPLHPAELKQWLDEAGIRNRVISVSACFSGSWIEPLANEDTLVLTAADAQHTSYGCGRKSDLTFFGRAMYDEQLRSHTLSFEQAYQAARQVIERREQEAGKDDGFSNPQMRVGANIRARLAALQEDARPRGQ
jgi:hypothetical protein